MTMLDAIKSFLSLDPAYRRKGITTTTGYSPITGDVFGPMGQRSADWSTVASLPRIHDAYRKCSVAYACVSLLADAVSESPLRVYQTVDGELEERPEHRARVLLANPNPIMSEAEFLSLLVMTMGMYGYAIVEKVRSAAGLPVQLWPLRPDWLSRERSSDETVRLVYRVPGRDPRTIAPEDVLIIPYRHDERQTTLGITPLMIVAREIGVDVALTDLLKVFIDAGGIPPWVVKLTGDFSMEQSDKDLFREKWRQRFAGSQAYSTIGILDPGMDLLKVGDSIGDMAWPDLRGLTEMKICQAFRVPADLVQARDAMSSGSLTTTEMTGAMAFLQNHGAQPLRQRIDGAFSRGLLPDFGVDSSFSLEFDTSGILALQEDEDAKHNRWRLNFDSGLATWNEARQAIGLTDLGSDGEVIKLSFTTTLQPIGVTGNDATVRASALLVATPAGIRELPAGKAQRVYRNLKTLSPAEIETRASILATTQRERQKLTEIGARKLRAFFKAQGKRIAAGLPKQLSGIGLSVTLKAVAVDWDEEERLLRELLHTFYNAVGERAYGTIAATTGAEIAWDLANPNIARILDRLGQNIVDISETTREDVIRVITNGQAEGLSLPEIANNLEGMFEQTYTNRSLTIARTETQVSYNLASQLGYQESGVVDTAEMVDNPDHDTDPGSDGLTCADRHSMIVSISDMDRHIEAEHINGSLAFIPILSTPLGE